MILLRHSWQSSNCLFICTSGSPSVHLFLVSTPACSHSCLLLSDQQQSRRAVCFVTLVPLRKPHQRLQRHWQVKSHWNSVGRMCVLIMIFQNMHLETKADCCWTDFGSGPNSFFCILPWQSWLGQVEKWSLVWQASTGAHSLLVSICPNLVHEKVIASNLCPLLRIIYFSF